MKTDYIDKLNCFVDLHLHLDGALSLNSTRELAKIARVEIPSSDDDLLKIIQSPSKDLNEFLKVFGFTCSLLQTYEGLKTASLNLVKELKEQGLMYAEIRFAPQLLLEKGLTQEEALNAVIEGLNEGEIDTNIILCCMRGGSKELNLETVRLAKKYLNNKVVSLDLAGAEALFPFHDYEDVFNLALKEGMPFTIHAGEADGPKSVYEALKGGAIRIGHGVRSFEDEGLMKYLSEKNIPLELCPTSNLCTCVFEDLKDYPLRKYMDKGIVITINTDDPAIEGTTIRDEFKKMVQYFNLTKEEVKKIISDSIDVSFASEETKKKLHNKLKEEFESL